MRMNLSVITDLDEKEFVGEELEDVEPEEEPDDDAPVDIEFDEYSDYEEE